ncbi:MAG: MerR family transcriptional regulator [Sphingomonas taxi]|uniref:MerR family transcriptional regulator n=1 Tax=Sphingomonas taxi TaxID=1549858 RepID=A0A2W4Z4A7_9SPHN|nr:MAG: MerR family transcriptional regulator [Sphingomonas taxi]
MPGDADDGAPSTGGTGSTVEVGSTPGTKTEAAFRTIGELAADTGLPQHILRYWETRFPQLRPLQRAGNRRYYRAEDVALVRRIDTLLNREGYTVRGVQQLLSGEKSAPAASASATPVQMQSPIPALKAIRALLAQALIEDAA